jgi:hypothetical protein
MEWRGREVVEEDFTVEAALPQESAKTEDIAGKRELASGMIAVIDLKRSAVTSGMETLEVANDKGIRFKNVPPGEVAVYNPEGVQIHNTIDDIENPSLDILDPPLAQI